MLSRSIFLWLNLNGNALPYYRYTNFSFVTPPFLPQLQPSGLFCALLPCFPASSQAAALAVPWPLSLALSRTTFLRGRRATQRSTVSMWLLRLFMCASFRIRERAGMRHREKVGYLIPYLVVSGQLHEPNVWKISLAYVSDNALKSRTYLDTWKRI